MKIRTLRRRPDGWHWTEAVDADAPEGATVAEYVEVNHDMHEATHIGVYLVSAMDPVEAMSLGVVDITSQVHDPIGQLVAWVPLDGEVTYELVEVAP